MTKRISAWLLDVILLAIVSVGMAVGLSALLGFDHHNQMLDDCYSRYEAQYGVRFDLTSDEYAALSPESKENFDRAYQALSTDSQALYAYHMVMQLSILITSLSILFAYLLLEFCIPLWLKNGQTVGKKIFSIALMRTDGVQISAMALFIRTVLGKYTLETMIPVLIILMIFLGTMGMIGPIIIGLLLLVQGILLIASRTNSVIHDYLSNTVAVDMASQRIFRTTEELIAYQKQVAAEKAARQDY